MNIKEYLVNQVIERSLSIVYPDNFTEKEKNLLKILMNETNVLQNIVDDYEDLLCHRESYDDNCETNQSFEDYISNNPDLNNGNVMYTLSQHCDQNWREESE